MANNAPDDIARSLQINQANWDKVAGTTKGRTALPRYGPLCPTEEDLHLLGEVRGLKVLELGCGTGHSLAWLHARGAGELWGLDLSPAQIQVARATALEHGFSPTLLASPMECDPGLPEAHFDLAISIYALGWSVDLRATLQVVARALRPGGHLVFSWEHPVYSCLKSTPTGLLFDRPYGDESPRQRLSWNGEPIILHARKLSTFLNTLTECGFMLEKIIEGDFREESDLSADFPHRWYNQARAKLMPTTLLVKARV